MHMAIFAWHLEAISLIRRKRRLQSAP